MGMSLEVHKDESGKWCVVGACAYTDWEDVSTFGVIVRQLDEEMNLPLKAENSES